MNEDNEQERLEKLLVDFRSGELKYRGTNDEDLKRLDAFNNSYGCEQEGRISEAVQDYLLCKLLQEKDYSAYQLVLFRFYEVYGRGLSELGNRGTRLKNIVDRANAVHIRGE